MLISNPISSVNPICSQPCDVMAFLGCDQNRSGWMTA
jgi:hypothetical protein